MYWKILLQEERKLTFLIVDNKYIASKHHQMQKVRNNCFEQKKMHHDPFSDKNKQSRGQKKATAYSSHNSKMQYNIAGTLLLFFGTRANPFSTEKAGSTLL